MEAQLIQFSTAVVGKTHNPSILNPDFLSVNRIVQPDWGWETAENVTTPPFAVVRYSNGVAITVEFNKLQVTDVGVGDEPMESKAAEIATAYVRKLPHVRYAAAGINFQSIIAVESPEAYLKDRFVKPGPWHGPKRKLAAAGLRFVYSLGDQGRVTLSLDVGEAQHSSEKVNKKVIIANANFHRDCQKHPTHEQVAEHLTHVASDWSLFRDLLAEAITE